VHYQTKPLARISARTFDDENGDDCDEELELKEVELVALR
jgi:hypothetical protein